MQTQRNISSYRERLLNVASRRGEQVFYTRHIFPFYTSALAGGFLALLTWHFRHEAKGTMASLQALRTLSTEENHKSTRELMKIREERRNALRTSSARLLWIQARFLESDCQDSSYAIHNPITYKASCKFSKQIRSHRSYNPRIWGRESEEIRHWKRF